MYHDRRPMRLTDRSFALACIRLLQILSDPSRRLALVVEQIHLLVPPYDYAIVEQASNLLLRCNSRIVDISVEQCQHSRHDDSDFDVYSHAESDDLEWFDDADDPVRDPMNEMVAAAVGKTAIPHGALLPDMVILPSLRRRLALLSAFAAGGVQLPEAVLKDVFLLSGRRARRFKCFFRVDR
ncbi:hypothetical protein P43SY_008517 [Pythium insidiosum]|uniref:Uncharacterized protein n=1 Tax=Pythium insidiosum TaxID=114742 RepID=A0AAD5QAW7_PYTIN|nr:hypothetical protein P43SY_008517 [Pythium insidiosum]